MAAETEWKMELALKVILVAYVVYSVLGAPVLAPSRQRETI